MKRAYKFNTDGELINSYKSISEAARDVGVSTETLWAVLNGKRKSAAGFLWSFNSTIEIQKEEECKWKDIKGFEGKYQMSEDRIVRRLPFEIEQISSKGKVYKRRFPGAVLNQRVDCEGYYSVTLDDENYRIHWLYYNTFIGDSTGYFVDHIDRNKLNNDPSNLRLLDYKGSVQNRTLKYKPDITDCNKHYQKKHNGSLSKPYMLRFSIDGKRKTIGYFATYEDAENKYKELYEERQKNIDDSSKILTISN